MASAVLLMCGVLALDPGGPPRAEDLAAYREARDKAGRGAEAQLNLAFWCEAHGLQAERVKHLALAVLADPRNATARGLLGLVAYHGKWDTPDRVAEKVKSDAALAAALAEYNARRARTPETAEAQWKLALWCEQNKLDAEARAHLAAVVRLDPSREAAWKKLGCKQVGGRWVSDTQVAAERAESDAQNAADRKWRPLLAKWRAALHDREPSRRREADLALAEVNDPRAVPSVWSVFVAGARPDHARAVQLLGQIDTAGSSRALAFLAVFGPDLEVRRAATETLKRRDSREFAGQLIALIRDPIKYDVRPVGGPGSPGALFVEGERFNVQRLYAAPSLPPQFRMFSDWVPFDPFSPANLAGAMAGLRVGGAQAALLGTMTMPRGAFYRGELLNPSNATTTIRNFTGLAQLRDFEIGLNMVEVQKAAVASQQQLQNDIARVEAMNRTIQETNTEVVSTLNQATDAGLPESRPAWVAWWTDQLGYAAPRSEQAPKPTIVEVASPYQPVLNASTSRPFRISVMSCFGAGTLVRTLTGPVPIEGVQVGDRVLTQDVHTGALGYQPVTAVHHNPPSPTFRVKVGGDTVVSSPFHRFWVAGKGWVMARDLRGGETLRLLGGPARVESVESGPVQPVYNLDVAEAHDFFAGAAAALVHDNTLPDTRLVPFDAPREPTTATATARAE